MSSILSIETLEQLTLNENTFAHTLSDAFYNDDYYRFIMPDRSKRLSQLHWWMKILLKYTFKNGYIRYTEDKKGIALWLGPDMPLVSDIQMLLMGMAYFPFKVGLTNFLRLANINDLWNREHKKMPARHLYLMVLGVCPNFQ